MDEVLPNVKKENNRIFNLIWLILFVPTVTVLFLLHNNESFYTIYSLFSLIISLVTFLIIIIPRRNNFLSAFFLIIPAAITSLAFSHFYDLTWLFNPDKIISLIDGEIPILYFSICSWCLSLLTVLAFVYMFSSALCRAISKKTHAMYCFCGSIFLVGLVSLLLYWFLPTSFSLGSKEIVENRNDDIKVEFLDRNDIQTSNILLEIDSSQSFYVYIGDLSKGERYGLRIFDSAGSVVNEKQVFKYCWQDNCNLYFGNFNRWDPGEYTFQVISQRGKEFSVIQTVKFEIQKWVIEAYNPDNDYVCEMWLTFEDSSEKLLRIDISDSQKQTNIQVVAQCSEPVADAQIAVGTISQDVSYYSTTIAAGEPVRILSLGGNTSHGYVRLIVDEKIVGETIINRGFPICDNEKIIEGGQQSDCK